MASARGAHASIANTAAVHAIHCMPSRRGDEGLWLRSFENAKKNEPKTWTNGIVTSEANGKSDDARVAPRLA